MVVVVGVVVVVVVVVVVIEVVVVVVDVVVVLILVVLFSTTEETSSVLIFSDEGLVDIRCSAVSIGVSVVMAVPVVLPGGGRLATFSNRSKYQEMTMKRTVVKRKRKSVAAMQRLIQTS